eukprot:gene35576-46139_t
MANVNGGGVMISDSNSQITLTSNSIAHNSAVSSGGGMYVYQSNSQIVMTTNVFDSNTAMSYAGGAVYLYKGNNDIHMYNNQITNNEAKYFGGGMFVDSSNTDIRITGCTFAGNEGTYGGAVSIGLLNTDMSIHDTVFSRNEAVVAGAVHINQINSHISFRNVQFVDNVASQGNGGAMLINEFNSFIQILNGTFVGNVAVFSGGAICVSSFNSDVSILSSRFITNVAQEGGGLSLATKTYNVWLESLLFERNSVSTNGGGILINYKTNSVVMRQLTFLRNTAAYSGGGVYIDTLNVLISFHSCIFQGNIGAISGGGVLISQSNKDISMTQCLFNENLAGAGGGVFMAVENVDIRIDSSSFDSNNASEGNAGALFSGSSNVFTITRCNFTSNRALRGSGSVIYSDRSSSIYLSQSTFRSNSASMFGAIVLFVDHSNVIISKCDFFDNKANNGSCIYVTNSKDLELMDCNFNGNSASGSGGSVYVESVHGIVMRNIQMRNNVAADDGGSIFIENTENVIVTNSRISDSVSGLSGGAVYMNGVSSASLEGCSFDRNRARDRGGSVCIVKSVSVGVRTSKFSLSSSNYGSAIYIGKTGNSSVFQSIFQNNNASSSGTVYWVSSQMSEPVGLLSTCTWNGNNASYGKDYSTSSYRLKSPVQIFVSRDSSSFFLPPIEVTVLNYYDQQVLSNDIVTIFVSLSHWEICTPSALKGALSMPIISNKAVFDTLTVSCVPQGRIDLNFTTSTDGVSLLPSITSVYFPTFSPTAVPTSQPSLKQSVVIVQSDGSSSSTSIPNSAIISLSVLLPVFVLLVLLSLCWICVFSPKAVEKRRKKERLAMLPLHRILVGNHQHSSPVNNDMLLHLLRSHPEYADQRDYDGRSALDIIFAHNDARGVSSDVIYILLVRALEIDEDEEEMNPLTAITADSIWHTAIQRNDDNTVIAVEKVLHRDHAAVPRNDNTHSNNNSNSHSITVKLVALKFMRDKNQFEKETNARRTGDFDVKYVLPLLDTFDGDSDIVENRDFREDAIIKGFEEYPYCIVMEAATQDLKRLIDHENIAGMGIDDIRQMMRQLSCCLDHIHKKGLVHGDIKPLNILQKGTLLTLTDLDASSNIATDAVVMAGSKMSSGYLPPEMFWSDEEGVVRVRSAYGDGSEYSPVPAHPSQDMW